MKGFTLIEVLISLALISILVVIIFQTESLSLKVKEEEKTRILLSFYMGEILSKIWAGEKIPLEGKNEDGLMYKIETSEEKEFKKLYISVEGRGEKLLTTTGVYKFEE